MRVLGISAYYHDSAAAIIEDGKVVAAAQEERFTRRKHDPGFPSHAIAACLASAKMSAGSIDAVAFYEKPLIKFERLLETYMSYAPAGFRSFRKAMPIWVRDKLFQKANIAKALKTFDAEVDWPSRLYFSEHHLSHAASAFYPSPFERAAVLTMDGVGEWATTTLSVGNGADLAIAREIHFPHSLGLLYSAFTYYLGFKVNSGEYKVMGLAPYGEPKFAQTILDHVIDVKPDGSFRLAMEYFDFATGLRMTNARFDALFGGRPIQTGDRLTQREMDLAASIQAVCEEVVLRLARDAAKRTGERALCLAGGVALNCVANGKILRDGCFDDIWIQPAAGDAGGAIGAALAVSHLEHRLPRPQPRTGADGMSGAYLGPAYSQAEIERRLSAAGAVFTVLSDGDLVQRTVDSLEVGDAVGWHQGRMEFGPRALGGRSILGDPRSPTMQKTLNLRVKFRESFRPFAPSVRREDVGDWFDLDRDSPYMLLVADVGAEKRIAMTEEQKGLFGIDKLNIPRSSIPAVTHVDFSARIQTVDAATNAPFHALLTAWKNRTNCPVLVNTSFNIRGEPIVESPEDAFRCFMGTDIETLVVGNCFLRKADQDQSLARDYRSETELD